MAFRNLKRVRQVALGATRQQPLPSNRLFTLQHATIEREIVKRVLIGKCDSEAHVVPSPVSHIFAWTRHTISVCSRSKHKAQCRPIDRGPGL